MRSACKYNNTAEQKHWGCTLAAFTHNCNCKRITGPTGNCRSTTPTHATLRRKYWSREEQTVKSLKTSQTKWSSLRSSAPKTLTRRKLTRLVIYLCEDVFDRLVVILALGLGVGWRVPPLPAPLHHLSGLWWGEGLQAGRAVQHVLDNPLHCHRSLKLHKNIQELIVLNCTLGLSPKICRLRQVNILLRLDVYKFGHIQSIQSSLQYLVAYLPLSSYCMMMCFESPAP